MTKIAWTVLALFLVGNALFVLPVHLSKDTLTTSYIINYKKDSALIHAVFPDSLVCTEVTLPNSYETLYQQLPPTAAAGKKPCMHINVTLTHNVGFMSLLFPFYKTVRFNSDISFHSIITIGDMPGRDSVALIGNIRVNGNLSVAGICSPLYVRTLVEKSLMEVLKKEIINVEKDINRPPVVDTIVAKG